MLVPMKLDAYRVREKLLGQTPQRVPGRDGEAKPWQVFVPAPQNRSNWREILEPYRQVRRRRVAGIEQNVFRRSACDRGIWTKPLASAADAMGIQSTLIWKLLEVRVLAGRG